MYIYLYINYFKYVIIVMEIFKTCDILWVHRPRGKNSWWWIIPFFHRILELLKIILVPIVNYIFNKSIISFLDVDIGWVVIGTHI